MNVRALAAAAAIALTASGCGVNALGSSTKADAAAVAVVTTIVDVPAPVNAPPATATTIPPLLRVLEQGLKGEDVRVLQVRLNELRYDVGVPDGYFGLMTRQAIWSYERMFVGLRGKDVTGKVSTGLWERIFQPLGFADPRPEATGRHLTAYLAAQTLIVWDNHEIKRISHSSHGTGEEWCDEPRNVPAWPGATTTTLPKGQKPKRICGVSVTPGGVFKVYRKELDWLDIPLGRVHNPLFFNAGVAIHGLDDVPFGPASHGCIRVPMHISHQLPDLIKVGDDVFVFDGVEEPEIYGNQRPPLDVPDPNDTSETSQPKRTTTTKRP